MWNNSDSFLDYFSQPIFEVEVEKEQPGDMNEDQLISKLEREMRAAAERLDFEKAAQIRDRIMQLHNPTN